MRAGPVLSIALAIGFFAGCTGVIGEGAGEDPPPPSTVAERSDKGLRLPRLSHLQWARTAQAFLRLSETPKVSLRGDVFPDGAYETDDRGKVVDAALVRDYRAAADQIVDRFLDDGEAYARFVSEAGEGDAVSRLRTLIGKAWPRAYRRKLGEVEIERYVALGMGAPDYATAADDDGRLRAALRALLRTTLQSPHFVYRVELGDPATEHEEGSSRVRMLTDVEYATRLSYALFDAPPEAELAKDLAADRDSAVEAMLDDPRANAMLLRFHEALYLVDASRSMRKDAGKFPGMEGLGADAATEAERFLDGVVADGGGLRELLLSRKTFVNKRLASIYGLPDAGFEDGAFTPATLPPERGGILTRVSWTGLEADLFERSSILRGVFVTRKVLCTPLGNPPPGAEAMAQKPPSSLLSNRERVTYKTSADRCKGCHQSIINPTGFAFEQFDAVGRFVKEENGAPVDASGAITIDGEKKAFGDARRFLEEAAESSQAHDCYVQNLASYLFGRPPSTHDLEGAAPIAARSKSESLSVRALVKELAISTSFRSLVVEEP